MSSVPIANASAVPQEMPFCVSMVAFFWSNHSSVKCSGVLVRASPTNLNSSISTPVPTVVVVEPGDTILDHLACSQSGDGGSTVPDLEAANAACNLSSSALTTPARSSVVHWPLAASSATSLCSAGVCLSITWYIKGCVVLG